MAELVATRKLRYTHRETGAQANLSICIYKPYELTEEHGVDFEYDKGVCGCDVEIVGLNTKQFNSTSYGADSLQSLQLATNIEPILKRISQSYDIYFEYGEAYFED